VVEAEIKHPNKYNKTQQQTREKKRLSFNRSQTTREQDTQTRFYLDPMTLILNLT